MKTIWSIGSVFLIGAALAGCALPVQLNDPTRSTSALDTANLLAPRQIPFETKEIDGVAVSYNLFHWKSNNLAGYRLTLNIRNSSGTELSVSPRLTLKDGAGFLVQPYQYQSFMAEAASLAGITVPPMPASQASTYYSTGTIRNTSTGSTYSYSGSTQQVPAGGFASGFAQGMAQGAAIRAGNDREEGRVMLRWGNAFWLKSNYELPPATAVSGALFFPANDIGVKPLALTVEIGARKFEFLTAR